MLNRSISLIDGVLGEYLKGNLDAEIDLNEVDEEYRNLCEKLNSLLNYERENTKAAFERESSFKRIFLEISNLCSNILKGKLSQRMDTSALPFGVKSTAINLNRVFDSLQKNHDELLEINQNLEQKVKEQVEHIQKLSSMKRYISPQVAERLLSEGIAVGQIERKNLTVFFSDIRGFTRISEEMEPEELLGMLNKYFSEMTEIIFKYGGTIDKFMGDGILGFVGDPCEYPDHAERAVRMAVEMQSKLKALGEEWFSYGTSSLRIGIGVNTGYVTVGDVGSEAHMDYTAIGRHVNLAARLQQEAKPDQIIISQRTYSLVKDIVEAEEMGEVEMKGFDRPIRTYNVYNMREGLERKGQQEF